MLSSSKEISRVDGVGLTSRENFFLLTVFAVILFPSNSVVVNQIAGTLAPLILLLTLGKVNALAFSLALSFMVISLGVNFVFGNFSFIVFKPVFGLLALALLFSSERSLPRLFYEKLVKFSFAVLLTFFLFFLTDITEFLYIFRVVSQGDTVHLSRLTAPFLFAGDFGLACLFLAFLSFSLGGRTYFLIGAALIVFLIFTQSRLALAGVPFAYFFIRGSSYKIISVFFAITSSLLLLLYIDDILSHLPYVQRFFDNLDFYITQSKRAEEYIYVYNNFWGLFFRGTSDFELEGNLTSAESGIVSYIVKIGVLPTALFWIGFFIISIRRLKAGIMTFTIVLFYAVFAAPIDRPKLALITVLSIAGISSVRRISSK